MQAQNLNQSPDSIAWHAPASGWQAGVQRALATLRLWVRRSLQRSELRALAVLGRVARWRMRSRTRTQLSSLSDPLLKDIGLSRSDANREARKWFWEV